MWWLCLAVVLSVGFAVVDAVQRRRAVKRLRAGAFGSELQEIAEATDPQLVRALRNELTLSIEAELSRASGYQKGHTRICFGAGVLAVVLSVQSAPRVALVSGLLAAIGFIACGALGRSTTLLGRHARAYWRSQLGGPAVRQRARSGADGEPLQSE